MKYLKRYKKLFESVTDNQFLKTKEEIKNWLDELDINTYHINNDSLVVDVDSYVDISGQNLEYIPVKFGIVSYDFNCSNNRLKSLKGCPKEVFNNFYCRDNQLTTLEYCPEKIGLDMYFCSNKLLSFKGCPEKINRNFSFDFNPIFPFLCKVPHLKSRDFIKYINEYNVIVGNKIYLDRLKDVIYMIDEEKNSNFTYDNLRKLKFYEIIN